MGIEPGRLQFSWISSAEATKFADVATDVIETIRRLGPSRQFVKKAMEPHYEFQEAILKTG
jgi:coenzyme F420-reducing hydrogenase delta subunit